MKGLKIGQYLLSLLHLVGQVFIYISWSNGYETLTRDVHLEKGMVINATVLDMLVKLDRHDFKYVLFSLLVLAFYLTISSHIRSWITEAKIEGK